MTQFTAQQPRKLSEWFQQALADLQQCYQHPETYCIDMGAWHLGSRFEAPDDDIDEGHCTVCLAGSLLAQSFGADPTGTYEPNDDPVEGVPDDIGWLMMAINQLRVGNIATAICYARNSELCSNRGDLFDASLEDVVDDYPVDVCSPDEDVPSNMLRFQASMEDVLDALTRLGV